jgi:hypothetical protein
MKNVIDVIFKWTKWTKGCPYVAAASQIEGRGAPETVPRPDISN